ncbi:hypothetical protein AHAS_Ahas02G0143500 [Arachis hypogaea]
MGLKANRFQGMELMNDVVYFFIGRQIDTASFRLAPAWQERCQIIPPFADLAPERVEGQLWVSEQNDILIALSSFGRCCRVTAAVAIHNCSRPPFPVDRLRWCSKPPSPLQLVWFRIVGAVLDSVMLTLESPLTGTLKGYDQLLNLVLDEAVEFLRAYLTSSLSQL